MGSIVLLFFLIIPLPAWPQSNEVEVAAHSLSVRSQPSVKRSRVTSVSQGEAHLCVAPATSRNSAPPKPMPVPGPKSSGNIPNQASNTLSLSTFIGAIGVAVILSWIAISLRRHESKAMKTIYRLFKNPRFPATANEAIILLTLIKEAAIIKGGSRNFHEKKEFEVIHQLCIGLIPVLADLHRHLVADLHRDAQKSLKLLLGIGRAILNDLSKKGN